MQHQPIVKRVNGTRESAHRPHLSAPISSLSQLLVQTQVASWKAASTEQLTGGHLYLDIAKSGFLFHAVGNIMGWGWMCLCVWWEGVAGKKEPGQNEFNSVSTHYSDAMMGTIASQITSLTIVYSTIYSYADQRKHQSSASLAFAWGNHRSPHKWPVPQKMFPFDKIIMNHSLDFLRS